MLRLRTPQALGFGLTDIPIVGPLLSDAGNLLTGNICGALPVNILPGLKDLVARTGCTTVGRDALIVGINQAAGPVAAAVGAGSIAACLCQGQPGSIYQAPVPPPSPVATIFNNPIVWIGAAALVFGLVLSKKKSGGGYPTTATTTFAPVTVTTPATVNQ